LDRLATGHRLFDLEVRPREIEARQGLGIEREAVDVEHPHAVRIEAGRDAKLLQHDRPAIDARGNAPAIGADLVDDLAGGRAATVEMHTDQEGVESAAEIVQVGHEYVATTASDELPEQATLSERVGQIAVT